MHSRLDATWHRDRDRPLTPHHSYYCILTHARTPSPPLAPSAQRLDVPMGDGVVIAATCGGWAWENECSRNVVFDHTGDTTCTTRWPALQPLMTSRLGSLSRDQQASTP